MKAHPVFHVSKQEKASNHLVTHKQAHKRSHVDSSVCKGYYSLATVAGKYCDLIFVTVTLQLQKQHMLHVNQITYP